MKWNCLTSKFLPQLGWVNKITIKQPKSWDLFLFFNRSYPVSLAVCCLTSHQDFTHNGKPPDSGEQLQIHTFALVLRALEHWEFLLMLIAKHCKVWFHSSQNEYYLVFISLHVPGIYFTYILQIFSYVKAGTDKPLRASIKGN